MSDSFCDPVDCNPPESSVHGIFQARILEWVDIFFFRGWIFLTQGSKPPLLLGRQILYHRATWKPIIEIRVEINWQKGRESLAKGSWVNSRVCLPQISGSQLEVFLPPSLDVWQRLEAFLVVTTREKGRYWHLVGSGQGHCRTFCNAQDPPYNNKELSGPKCQQRHSWETFRVFLGCHL